MLFCHLGRAQSLREICGGLAASEGKLRHLGLPDAPKHSTLFYANEHRPWQLYRAAAGPHGFRFENKLLRFGSTNWALRSFSFYVCHANDYALAKRPSSPSDRIERHRYVLRVQEAIKL